MKINEKIIKLQKTIEEIISISEKLGNNNIYETKINELNNEISRLKKGINESVEELEEFLEEENARP
tara:strand:- start:404 stop:604 length:201 start_codon:yes stop_codon:yes gene_type:complete